MKKVYQYLLPEIKYILMIFIATRIILTLVGSYSHILIEPKLNGWYEWNYSKHVWLNIWSVWDSGWYLDIAKNGYSPVLQSDLPKKTCCGQSNLVFLPLYPLTIRFLGNVIGSYHTAGIVLSNIYLILSCILIYELVRKDLGVRYSKLAVLFLLTFPSSFVLSSLFSESLLMFLFLGGILSARRNHWLLASIFGFLSSLTKITGIFMLPIIFLEYYLKNHFRFKKEVLYFLIIPLGLIIFMVFTYSRFGDFWAYFNIRSTAWNVRSSNPLMVFFNLINSNQEIIRFIFLYFIIYLLFAIAIIFSKLPEVYKLFSIIFIITPLLSGTYVMLGYLRISSIVFTIPIFIATLKMKKAYISVIVVFMMTAQIVLMSFWSNGLLGY